jgi:hypothetical protein
MDRLSKGEPHDIAEDFRNLPVKNRVNLIKTAQSLLEVQKAYRENAVLPDAPLPSDRSGEPG